MCRILSLFLKSDFLKKFQVASGNAAGTGLRPGPAATPQRDPKLKTWRYWIRGVCRCSPTWRSRINGTVSCKIYNT